MSQIRELLIEQLQDLLHAEGQLTNALPKMADAAQNEKLKEALQKHLIQTQDHVERLHQVFEMLGEKPKPKACKAMMGLIEEGEETIAKNAGKKNIASDLALISAAQRVEHYEIACYGTVRILARQLGEIQAARLLTRTLGEEESSDFLLTAIADPLIQQAAIEDSGHPIDLERTVRGHSMKKTDKPEKVASRGR
jgi:Mn-containing catalase